MNTRDKPRTPILSGIRILDISHQYSGANCAAMLADLGAEVLAIEHPKGSPIRTMLPKKDGESLWWKVVQRGKQNITLNLSSEKGREIFFKLVKDCDALIENFRPGTLERWKIGPEDLEKAGANLALLRISGYGQTGPSRDLPGFGAIGEAISGFVHLNGFPDGPPVFPSTSLADGVASVFGAFGLMAALLNKARNKGTGVEVIDVALFEGLFRIVPTQVAWFDQFGKAPIRPGNFLGEHGVLRNVYRASDGKYLIVSSVGPQAIRRILAGAGADELVRQLDAGAMDNRETGNVYAFLSACDVHLHDWAGKRTYGELAKDLTAHDAVFGPVFDASDIAKDPHYQARGDLLRVPDAQLGSVLMQGVVPKFPARDHTVPHAGPARGVDNDAVYGELGFSEAQVRALKKDGVV